ncbi:MAG: acyl-CoA dehydrogenase family protein, partial [Myxococcales bacterium]|nr:acyl-CoA dehydrogenase family protein [Myxococcales bacterium]
EYLKSLGSNWFNDDALLQRLLNHFSPAALDAQRGSLQGFGETCAEVLAPLSQESGRPENAPYLRHFDAYRRRVDEIVLPEATREAFRIVEGQHRLGVCHGDPFVFYSKVYMYVQNGEAGVGCSMACTDGMIRLLEALGDHPIHTEALNRVRNSTYDDYAHAAQFVTEIQGGSDAGANSVVAVEADGHWTLHGPKWFCSNITADYFVVTARPEGAPPGPRGVALFLVPAYQSGTSGPRNGYVIERLKDKLGTRELPTAEVTFDGAKAYPI